MKFNPGDRVVYTGTRAAYIAQSRKNTGTVLFRYFTDDGWTRVQWDHGYTDAYPTNELAPLDCPDMTGAVEEYEDILAGDEVFNEQVQTGR